MGNHLGLHFPSILVGFRLAKLGWKIAPKSIKKALENAANPIYEVNEGEIVEERELGEAVSTVIGQKGKNIHKIKDESKVRIKIAKKATKCFIIGTPENVKKAQNMIDETISRYENFLAKKKTADEVIIPLVTN